MKAKLHKTQFEVATDPHRFKVICAGRRWGKSVLSRLIVLKWAIERPGLYWIVSPTYQQGKDIHWLQGFKIEVPPQLKPKFNEGDSLSVTLGNGSVIQLKSSENPDRLKGVKLNGLVVDEIASMRNWGWIWQEALRPTLVDYEAPAIFISTPKGFNHFYDLFTTKDPSYKSWKFTSYDNPYVPPAEIDEAKRTTEEDYFMQEYMADFRKYTGLVYKSFDRERNIIPYIETEGWVFYRGMDFGSNNPTACIWVAVDNDDNWYVVDEYYNQGQTIDYHAGVINSNSYSGKVLATFGDPSGAQWITEFGTRNLYITPANKQRGQNMEGWVRMGIGQVEMRLKQKSGHMVPHVLSVKDQKLYSAGMPRLYIFSNCVNTIKEFEQYRWRENKMSQAQDMNNPEQPEKANDHIMDALRYFAVSYKSIPLTDRKLYGDEYQRINSKENKKVWQIGK